MSFCSIFCVDYVYTKAEIEIGSLHAVFGLRKSPQKNQFWVFSLFFSLFELASSLILIYIKNNFNLMLILIDCKSGWPLKLRHDTALRANRSSVYRLM